MNPSPNPKMSSVPLVAPLNAFGRTSIPLAGGKGANLGELQRAGFDVPPGFVITTSAYDLAQQAAGLPQLLRQLLASLDFADLASVSQFSTDIRRAFLDAPIPDPVQEEILDAYHHLGRGDVAVRSSATAEDLPGAAFAGQQETFLNVSGEPALVDAVKSCWASLWSERALLYRAHQNMDQLSVKLAVVVQRMVPADAAGVMFTANPLSGSLDELVIDASPGLGEAVVGGLVTPDQFVLRKRGALLIEQQSGRQEVIIRPKSGGGTEQITPAGDADRLPSLPLPAVRRLARLGLAIERHYRSPQDIEWAWQADSAKNGHFYVLQARPVTALPKPVKLRFPVPQLVPMLVEMLPERPYPLDMTTFTPAVEKGIGNLLVDMVGKSAPDPSSLLVEEDGVVVRFEPPHVRPSPGILIHPWQALWRSRRYDPAKWQDDPLLAEVVQQARELERQDLRPLTWQQNLDLLHAALAAVPRTMELRQRYLPKALLGLAEFVLLLKLAGCSACFGKLIAGIETRTTETNRRLDDLAAEIRRDPQLSGLFLHTPAGSLRPALEQLPAGRDFLGHFDAFLDRYGHREVTLSISQGAWKDQPAIVLDILKVLAAAEPHEADNPQAWKEQRDALLAHTILGVWPLRSLFLGALAYTRYLFQIREDTHFYVTMFQPPLRHLALDLGQRLEKAGALDSVEEVFHLRLEELERLGAPWPPSAATLSEVRGLVALRKAKRQSLMSTPLVDPRLLAAGGEARPGEAILVRGSPGSPGVARGPVCVVHDSSEFGRLQPGDVLVSPATNPAWTPLFQRAAAVVVDTGGAASHAAIVAREYGVPAVMGTIDGTRQLKDGQRVQVDGSRGLVLKVKETE